MQVISVFDGGARHMIVVHESVSGLQRELKRTVLQFSSDEVYSSSQAHVHQMARQTALPCHAPSASDRQTTLAPRACRACHMSGDIVASSPPPSTTLDLLLSASLPPLTCAASPASCPQGVHRILCHVAMLLAMLLAYRMKLFRSSLCMAWIIHSRLRSSG
jgi:hypothetical protein